MKTRVGLVVCVMVGILGLFIYLASNSCNPKGSIAAKINWAGRPVCK